MLAVPLATLLLGVKMLRRTVPRPVSALKVPPVTVTSVMPKLVPGSSENVKQTRLVSPLFKVESADVMTTLGAVVSTAYKMLSVAMVLVSVTALPAWLLSVLPFSVRAVKGMAMPLASSCPDKMV